MIRYISLAIIISLAITASANSAANDGTLVAVTLIARHGDRSPTRIPAKWLPYWTQLGVAAGEVPTHSYALSVMRR
jgi:hypothetical protein